ncbi:lipopolysaccharide biosynthesis protein [Miniimonas sp. S16]|uniref:lipopolysaccharide biosynthesis protein n=1 Tax=Miniimonas sp. S16 TaxID=2171623 RepID=UPI001F42E86F|nr:oligosaccharide flippase family protein [Miniimonas sp. S16]
MSQPDDVSAEVSEAVEREVLVAAAQKPKLGSSSALRQVGSTAVVKIAAMALAGVAGVVTARLILQHYGIEAYAQYGVLASLPALLPFADLGVAAVLVNVIAESKDPTNDREVRRTITSAFRILLGSAAVIAAFSIVAGLAHWWPALIGDALMPNGGVLAVTLCGVVFALALPLGVGQRLLVSSGKTALQTAFTALGSPLVLGLVGISVVLAWQVGPYVGVYSYVANAVVAGLCLLTAARLLRPQVGAAIRDVPRVRKVRGAPVIDVAWPMLLQMMALPIAMQTGRLILSHMATPQDIAEYTIAYQLFNMIVQTVGAAGLSLWPLYARARAAGRPRSPMPASWLFLAAATVLALLLWAVMPTAVDLISAGKVTVSAALSASFVVFVALQAFKYPAGMYMTDAAGLKFQVVPIILMIPISLGLSFILVPSMGASGPVIGTSAAVLLCQVLPNWWYVKRSLRRGAPAPAGESVGRES